MKKITLSILLMFPVLCISQTPDWQWAKNYSLALNSGKQYTAADNQGNVYLAGDFSTPAVTVAGYTFINFEPGTADITLSNTTGISAFFILLRYSANARHQSKHISKSK